MVGSEGCDDNGTASGDGCSPNCTVEPAFFCQGAPSACYSCLPNCLSCSDNSSCVSCNPLSDWNSSSLACEANCSAVTECSTCDILNGSTINCTGCSYGFSLDTANNLCS